MIVVRAASAVLLGLCLALSGLLPQKSARSEEPEPATVSGRVTDSAGLPLPGVRVCLCTGAYGTQAAALTDDLGRYELEAFNVSHLVVKAEDPSEQRATRYWPDAYIPEEGTRLFIDNGDERSGLDLELPSYGAIEGRASEDLPRDPVGSFSIFAEASEPGSPSFGRVGIPNRDGSFTISRLPPLDYKLKVKSADFAEEWVPDQPTPETATAYPVVEGLTTEGVDIRLDPLSLVAGRVTDSSGRPVPDVQVIGSRTDGGTAFSFRDEARTDELGRYELGLQPGTYTIGFDAYPRYFGGYWSGALTPDGAEELTVGRRDVDLGIDTQLVATSKIAGRLTDGTGRPVRRVDVTAYDSRRQTTYRATSDDEGRFLVDGLVPGAYTLSALDELQLLGDYLHSYWPGVEDRDDAEVIRLGLEEIRARTDFVAPRAAKIVGDLSLAAPDTIVTAIAERRQAGRWGLAHVGFSGSRDRYEISPLRPGIYRIRFEVSSLIGAGDRSEWWKDAYRAKDARVFRLRSGEVVRADARLSGSPPRQIVVRSAAALVGTPRVGSTLRVRGPRVNTRGVERTYEWRVGGRLLARTDGPRLRVTRAMRGERVRVRVTVRKPGWVPVEARKKSPRIRARR